MSLDEAVSFHNYSGSHPHNFGQLQNYYASATGRPDALEDLHESRISCLEAEVAELRKQLVDLLHTKGPKKEGA